MATYPIAVDTVKATGGGVREYVFTVVETYVLLRANHFGARTQMPAEQALLLLPRTFTRHSGAKDGVLSQFHRESRLQRDSKR